MIYEQLTLEFETDILVTYKERETINGSTY